MRPIKRRLQGLVLALLAAPLAHAGTFVPLEQPATVPLQGPELSVDGTAFVLRLADGRVLRGTQMLGATVHLALPGGQLAELRLKSIAPDPQDPDILRHEFEQPDGQGGWKSGCEPNFYGETWGFPIALPAGHPGREGAITLTCSSGAVGKCVRFGYKPWVKGPQGEDLLPYHAACVHLVRADYAGDDQPHTRNGTNIDIYDHIGIQKPETTPDPAWDFEAGWAPGGAVCVRHTRWNDLLTLDQLHVLAPALPLASRCDEAKASAAGALLFDRSKG